MNAQSLMTSVAIETALSTTSALIDVVKKYEAAGIDVVPISELKVCMEAGMEAALKEDSVTTRILKGMNND